MLELGDQFLGESAVLFGRGLDGPIGRNGIRSVNRTEVGRSIGEFWVWEFDGICGTAQYDEATDTCNGIAGIQPGDTLFRDLNGDGVIDDDDRSFQGQGIPKIFGGVTSALSLGAFELETLFTYSLGPQAARHVAPVRALRRLQHQQARRGARPVDAGEPGH